MSSDEELPQPVHPLRLRPPQLNMALNNPLNIAQPVANVNYPPGFHMSILNEIPKFEGNPSELSEYIRAVEDIFTQFYQYNDPNAYVNKLLLSAARNRIKGAALEVVTGQTINSWDNLKNILIENFGDQRSELNLSIDMSRLHQNQKENPIEFYNRCRSLLAIINSKIALINDPPAIKNYKLSNAKNLTLKTFISGLTEPLGSFIRSRSPATLENALTYIKDELDIRYFQNLNNPNKTPYQQNHNTKNQTPQKPWHTNNYPRPVFQPFTFPNRPNNFMSNTNPSQIKRQQQNHFEPKRNVFAPNQRPQFNKPEPMDFSTIKKRPASAQIGNFPRRPPFPQNNPSNSNNFQQRSFPPTNQFTNNNQRPNFRSQEINHLSTDSETFTENYPIEQNDQDYNPTYDQEYFHNENYTETNQDTQQENYYDESTNYDENFQIEASEK